MESIFLKSLHEPFSHNKCSFKVIFNPINACISCSVRYLSIEFAYLSGWKFGVHAIPLTKFDITYIIHVTKFVVSLAIYLIIGLVIILIVSLPRNFVNFL